MLRAGLDRVGEGPAATFPTTQQAPTSILTTTLRAAELPGFAGEGPILVEVDAIDRSGRTEVAPREWTPDFMRQLTA